jgi:hypothetical protein
MPAIMRSVITICGVEITEQRNVEIAEDKKSKRGFSTPGGTARDKLELLVSLANSFLVVCAAAAKKWLI